MKISFLFIFFLSATAVRSQSTDSLKHKYINQTITPYGSYFLKGNEKLLYRDLPQELKISELAMVSFNLAKRNRNTAIVYRYISLASALASISFIRGNRDLAYGFLGGNIVFTILGARHMTLYKQHLDRALWLYNKDVLFPGNEN
jgi:hypothetical protein